MDWGVKTQQSPIRRQNINKALACLVTLRYSKVHASINLARQQLHCSVQINKLAHVLSSDAGEKVCGVNALPAAHPGLICMHWMTAMVCNCPCTYN